MSPSDYGDAADKPRLMGDYLIHGLIGEGGMGKVYEAEERLTRRRVALKVLHGELSASAGGRRQFVTEMSVLSRLDDPHIVRCLHCAEIDGVLVMALELLHGQTLRQTLRAKTALPWPVAAAYARQIALALRTAHSSRPPIIHRDLKPENVMCLEAGRIKVMDFGIAKILETHAKHSTHASGTLSYMSPEQIDARPLDGRSDLFSLGTLMWEMIAGYPPFESDSPRILLERICTEPAPGLPQPMRDAVPQPLQQLIAQLLEKDAQRRPSTAAEVLTRLEQIHAPAPAPIAAPIPAPAPAPLAAPVAAPVAAAPRSPSPSPFPAPTGHAPARMDTLAVVEQAQPRPASRKTFFAFGAGVAVALTCAIGASIMVRDKAPDPDNPSEASPASNAIATNDDPPAASREPECSPAAVEFWQGSWTANATSTEAIKPGWIGGKSRYELTLAVEGCGLRGSGARFVGGKKTWDFVATGEVEPDGGLVLRYSVPGRKLDGTWKLASSGVGTWASDAGDISGTLSATRSK